MREVHSDPRLALIRKVCGYGKPIHQIWLYANSQRGLDLHVQTIGQRPFGLVAQVYLSAVGHYSRGSTGTALGDILGSFYGSVSLLQSWGRSYELGCEARLRVRSIPGLCENHSVENHKDRSSMVYVVTV